MTPDQNKSASKRQSGQTAIAIESLGSRIVAGIFAIDKPLPVEQELADELGVSRNSLREAVKVLSGKGLLTATPRRGTFACPSSQWNLFDHQILRWHLADPDLSHQLLQHIAEMRRIVEPNAARLAAKRATKEDVGHITAAYSRMEQSMDDPGTFVLADVDFHRSVLLATHNNILCQFQNAITVLLETNFMHFVNDESFEFRQNTFRHRDLAFAIAGGEEERAFETAHDLLDVTELEISKMRDAQMLVEATKGSTSDRE